MAKITTKKYKAAFNPAQFARKVKANFNKRKEEIFREWLLTAFYNAIRMPENTAVFLRVAASYKNQFKEKISVLVSEFEAEETERQGAIEPSEIRLSDIVKLAYVNDLLIELKSKNL